MGVTVAGCGSFCDVQSDVCPQSGARGARNTNGTAGGGSEVGGGMWHVRWFVNTPPERSVYASGVAVRVS